MTMTNPNDFPFDDPAYQELKRQEAERRSRSIGDPEDVGGLEYNDVTFPDGEISLADAGNPPKFITEEDLLARKPLPALTIYAESVTFDPPCPPPDKLDLMRSWTTSFFNGGDNGLELEDAFNLLNELQAIVNKRLTEAMDAQAIILEQQGAQMQRLEHLKYRLINQP